MPRVTLSRVGKGTSEITNSILEYRKLRRGKYKRMNFRIYFNDDLHPRSEKPYSYIAAINEFGNEDLHIPPRPFMRESTPKFREAMVRILLDHDYEKYPHLTARDVEELKQTFKDILGESIRNFSSPPNAPRTVKRKGFNDPLVETGGLQDAIEVDVERRQNF